MTLDSLVDANSLNCSLPPPVDLSTSKSHHSALRLVTSLETTRYAMDASANMNRDIASSSEETSSSSVLCLQVHSDSRCTFKDPGIQHSDRRTDGLNRAYDNVTDAIWDRMNKGVGFLVAGC
jgi:hypothetical protein